MYMITGGLLIFGIGLETSLSVCMTGVFLCIVFYASTKVLLYLFLIEKVHVVWSTSHNTPRLRSPIYLIGLGTILLYAAVGIVLIIGRVHYLHEGDGYCYIGLKFYASLTLLSYDIYITFFLTALFLWPLMKSKLTNPRIQRVASRTLVSAAVALTMSTINVAVLTAWHGHERGWMCLTCCTTDIIFNALALFWVTKDAQSSSTPSSKPNGANTSDTPAVVMRKLVRDRRDGAETPIEERGQSVQVMVTTVRERDDDSYEDIQESADVKNSGRDV
ncbi:hypothetical protein VKT23_009813 [Stygiomarasmius scandens]|uniref:Transmembrane protein n=1 Tax=Marasmiellus scandens TaxID=2682957 RepID=A0ABR1JGR2_9AGAR